MNKYTVVITRTEYCEVEAQDEWEAREKAMTTLNDDPYAFADVMNQVVDIYLCD